MVLSGKKCSCISALAGIATSPSKGINRQDGNPEPLLIPCPTISPAPGVSAPRSISGRRGSPDPFPEHRGAPHKSLDSGQPWITIGNNS